MADREPDLRDVSALLRSLFSPEAFRVFLGMNYAHIRDGIPSGSSLQQATFDAAETLERRGELNDAFFNRLKDEFPNRRADIEAAQTTTRLHAERTGTATERSDGSSVGPVIHVFNGPVITGDGGIVGNKYENKGQVGAMGDNAVARNNTFIQGAPSIPSDVELTPQDAAIIETLSEVLQALKTEQLQNSERILGVGYLIGIAEAAQSAQPLEAPVTGWLSWIEQLGDRAEPVLSALAQTPAPAPVTRLLRLPASTNDP